MTDIVERLLRAPTLEGDLNSMAAIEIEQLRERIEELEPYEVVSGDTWKARVSYEQLMEQTAQIRLLTHTIDTLNARIKVLQAKVKEYQAPTQSSPELEGMSG